MPFYSSLLRRLGAGALSPVNPDRFYSKALPTTNEFLPSSESEERPTEPFKDGLPQLGVGFCNLRKIFHPFVRLAASITARGIHQGF
jgi:hypothetical protein